MPSVRLDDGDKLVATAAQTTTPLREHWAPDGTDKTLEYDAELMMDEPGARTDCRWRTVAGAIGAVLPDPGAKSRSAIPA